MTAISDLSSMIRVEISSLVAMSFFRPAMRSERSVVVTVGGSTSLCWSASVSISLDIAAWEDAGLGVGKEAMALLNCSTASEMMVRRERISAFKDDSSAA